MISHYHVLSILIPFWLMTTLLLFRFNCLLWYGSTNLFSYLDIDESTLMDLRCRFLLIDYMLCFVLERLYVSLTSFIFSYLCVYGESSKTWASIDVFLCPPFELFLVILISRFSMVLYLLETSGRITDSEV